MLLLQLPGAPVRRRLVLRPNPSAAERCDGRPRVGTRSTVASRVLGPDGTHLASYGTSAGVDTVGGLSGDLRGVLVDDANNRVYVADALQNQVEVFSLTGRPLFHLGGRAPTAAS